MLSCVDKRIKLADFLCSLILIQSHKLSLQESMDVFLKHRVLFKLSEVLRVDYMKKVYCLMRVLSDHEERNEGLERCRAVVFIKLSSFISIYSIKDYLEALCCLKMILLMNVVSN